MKRIITFLLTSVMLFACVFGLCGCKTSSAKDAMTGEFFELKDIYESGEITRQDLLSIAYYSNHGIPNENKEQYPEDFEPTPKNPVELDKKAEKTIAKNYMFEIGCDFEYECVINYYGKYGEYYAVKVMIEIPDAAYPDEIYWVEIDGVGYYCSPYTRYIIMYKNNSL